MDTVDEITRFFVARRRRGGGDDAAGPARPTWCASAAPNYGHAFEEFAERYGDAIGPKTSLLILGDARSNYQPPALDTLRRLAAGARHAYWLNPEPRAQWDTGDSLATAYGGVVPMHECRNVAQLAAFIEELA